MGTAVRSIGDVRFAVECELKRDSKPEKIVQMRRTSAAGYLMMLAEEVRKGTITSFDVSWDGGNEFQTHCQYQADVSALPLRLPDNDK